MRTTRKVRIEVTSPPRSEAYAAFSYLVGENMIYSNEKGSISVLYPCQASMQCYEIYCLKGNLMEDIERFETLEEAEYTIATLLS